MGEIAFEYKKMLDRAFKEKIKELVAEFKMDLMIFKDMLPEKILCELLIKNKDFFPPCFMHFERELTPGIYCMYYLGEINGRNLFFYLDEKFICEEISKGKVKTCGINDADILKVLKLLEEKVENGIKSDEVAVPKGYVALSHKYKFISISGREEEGDHIIAHRRKV